MRKTKLWVICMCAALCAAMAAPVYGSAAQSEAEQASDAAEETEVSDRQLSAPTEFILDPNTGEYSFQANDDRIGYYFVRFYLTQDGKEVGEYVASSKRINGGKKGEFTGKIDLSDVAWGTYHVNLTSFAPAGTDYVSPAPVTLTVQYGVGQTLERPEMLVMSSGNTVEFVVDWWTLCDYNFLQYMPNMEFTVYSDAECTQEVMSDTVDLNTLVKTRSMNPPGLIYIWGWSTTEGPHFYTVSSDSKESTFAFKNDIYTYTLEPGTYYAVCQALAKDEYTLDSKVSTPVEFTLTDGECTQEYTAAVTELWKDPQLMDMPGANPGQQTDRVDCAVTQEISGQIID